MDMLPGGEKYPFNVWKLLLYYIFFFIFCIIIFIKSEHDLLMLMNILIGYNQILDWYSPVTEMRVWDNLDFLSSFYSHEILVNNSNFSHNPLPDQYTKDVHEVRINLACFGSW